MGNPTLVAMMQRLFLLATALGVLLLGPSYMAAAADEPLLGALRQLTFEGRASGKAHFSADGHTIIFESAREAATPSPQVYLLKLGNGELRRVSPGPGPAAAGAIHLDSTRALFAATDGGAGGKENFDVLELDLSQGIDVNLTNSAGYDGEATYSPNGRLVVFVSNRHAYAGRLNGAEAREFARAPSTLNDIYIMGGDGAGARRLTRTLGDDGMPAVSADGGKIVWRRVAQDGRSAEIFTMNADGTGERPITRLGALASAPTFHPSGDYVVFSAPAAGREGTELYVVDAEGRRNPVRVTRSDGVDGEPAFTRLGDALAWTSQRAPGGVAQIFVAQWDHDEARRLLALDDDQRRPGASALLAMTRPGFSDLDARLHIGRLATSTTETAVAYAASIFAELGLEPAGDGGTYVQDFSATVGTAVAADSRLAVVEPGGASDPVVHKDWRPLAFSGDGFIRPAPLVFAGWGLATPAEDGAFRSNSYGELDVGGKWVLVLPGLPATAEPGHASYLARYADLRHKAAVARRRGALGIVVVSPPASDRGGGLIEFRPQSMLAADTPAITITDALATRLLRHAGKDLSSLRSVLGRGGPVAGFPIAGVTLAGRIALSREQRAGRNVLGRLGRKSPAPAPAIMVGASLMPAGPGTARDTSFAAEDAASGVAGLLEIAQNLSRLRSEDGLEARRDIVFAMWGGEPGTLGAAHFAKSPTRATAAGTAAYLHLDMIGRLGARMALQGIRSSADWAREIERANAPVALPVVTEGGGFLPGAATVFFQKKVPVLNAFTGAAFHRAETNGGPLYSGVAKVARLMSNIVLSAARRETAPSYVHDDPRTTEPRRRFLLAALPPAERDAKVAPMPRPSRHETVELAALPAPPRVPFPSEPAVVATTPMKVEATAVDIPARARPAEPAPTPPALVEPPTAEVIKDTPPARPLVLIAAVVEPTPTRPKEPTPTPPPLAKSPTADVIKETPPARPPVLIAAAVEPTPVRPKEPAPTPPPLVKSPTAEVIKETPPARPPVLIAAVVEPTPTRPTEPAPMPPPIQVAAAQEKSPGAKRNKARANGSVEIARVSPSAAVRQPPRAAAPVVPLVPALGQSGRLGKPLASAGGSCVRKNRGAVVFCIEAIDWPADLEGTFDTSTLMYRGTKAIVRYDDGKATGFHTLFQTQDFALVVSHFEGLLGKPSASPERRIAPLAKPRQANPTRVWRIAGEAGGAVLEVRQFDDARGGFPDTKHGVVVLGRTPVRAIFPQLSSLDLMMIR